MKTMVKVLLIGLVVVVALVAFLLLNDFDSPRLGQTLLAKINAATGVNITAKSYRLNLLHGLVLEGVEATSETPSRRTHLLLDRMVFEHRLAPLFSGTVAIDKVLFERPQIEIVESAATEAGQAPAESKPAPSPPASSDAQAPTASPSPEESRQLSLELREFSMQDALITLTRPGKKGGAKLEGLTVNMTDVTLSPNAKSLAGLAGNGSMTLARGTLDTLSIRDAETTFQLKDSRFEMPELALVSDYGRLAGETHVDFNPTPFSYRMKARGDEIDLNKIVGSPGGLGPAVLNLTADGSGTDSRDVNANGDLKLGAGKLPAIAALSEIDKALKKTVLVGSPYKATDARFTLKNDVLTLAPFHFEAANARVDLDGTASLDGPLNLDLSLATPAEGLEIDGVGASVLNVLSDPAGWVPLSLNVSGTLEQPNVRLDTKALLAQAKEGTKREAKEAGQRAAARAKETAKEKAAGAIRRALPRNP